jgi:MYXO-CTERM domain-containing protein
VLDGDVSVHFAGSAPHYQLTALWNRKPAARLANARVQPESVARAAALAAARDRAATGTIDVAQVTPAALAVGADELRAGWRVKVATTRPVHLWDVWVDGETGVARVRRDLVWHVDGSAMVYLPNPVTSTGNIHLADNDDQTSAALDAARVQVTLHRLDGSGQLKGDFVDVVPGVGTRVKTADNNFVFDRSQTQFEEVNAYHAIDDEQVFVQSLGFTGARGVLDQSFLVKVDTITEDNSFYTVKDGPHIETGTGGVDDAEDGDVLHHEYGHAMQDDIIPGYGTTNDALAMGEGFGDIMAASTPTGAPVLVDRACIAPWDATYYSPPDANPPCLRRVDGQRHYPETLHVPDPEPHDDGEIWSGAIWDLFEATGLGPEQGAQLVIEAFFHVSTGVTFAEFCDALVVADTALHQGAHVDAIKKVLWRHGLLRTILPPGTLEGGSATVSMGLTKTHLDNNVDEETTIHQDGATAIRLHFAGFDMQSGTAVNCLDGHCDNVYLYDGDGRLYAILGGQKGAFDAPIVPGDTVLVRWVTDGSVSSGGFNIDRYEWSDAGAGNGDGGCGCKVAGQGGTGVGGAGLLLGALALVHRRRRRA